MKKIVFCEVAWMKYYSGISDDDKPMNGGKYITENEDGEEVYNFSPYNHKCYGYVMHYGKELHIERYGKEFKNVDEIDGVTVVWVASDGKSSKIVGWYENATMYRKWKWKWKWFYDIVFSGEKYNDYNFVADEKDCYLIAEADRSFTIPRAMIAGKGRGMGRSQVWYAESAYAQEEIIPEVLKYLQSMKEECSPFYYEIEDFSEIAEDNGETAKELLDKYVKLSQSEDCDAVKLCSYINLAIEKDDCHDTRAMKGNLFEDICWYDEAEEEYKKAIYYEQNPDTMASLMYVELRLGHTFLAIELGEKLRIRKDEIGDWEGIANNLTFLYIEEGEFDAANALIEECEKDITRTYGWIEKAKEVLKEKKG